MGFRLHRKEELSMKFRSLTLTTLLSLFFLTGCWSRTEINNIAIVSAVALDKIEKKQVLLSIQVILPVTKGKRPGQDSSNQTTILSESGSTVFDAYKRIQSKIGRKVFFSQNQIIIVGEKLARDGVLPYLDFFTRDRQSRLRSYILITEGTASSYLQYKPIIDSTSSTQIVHELEILNSGIEVNLRDFYEMILSDVGNTMARRLIHVPTRNKSTKQTLAVSGLAIFQKDKLVGWLGDKETTGLQWLTNKITTAITTVEIPQSKGGGSIGTEIYNAKTVLTPNILPNNIELIVEIRADGDVQENASNLILSNSEAIEYVEQRLEQEINKSATLALHKTQKQFKTDVIGAGTKISRSYPKIWNAKYKKNWAQIFPNVKFKINTQVTITRSGLLVRPIVPNEENY